MLRGAIAAALTPLRGGRLDEEAVAPYLAFLADGGLDGVLAMGTTGEGMLFDLEERKRIASAFVAERGSLQVAVHAGMQATATTAALAEHAATIGADAVAVIPPPYFPLDDDALFAHLRAAADACAPVPFYVYEFERTAGYAVSRAVLDRLRDACPNLAGMKVSDTPWEAFERYLDVGLDVFVGPEGFIGRGVERGAVGAVSALGSAFPEHVARAVRERSDELSALREVVERFPRHAALTPLRGGRLDEEAVAPYLAFLAAGGLDGVLAMGTTGEGMLFDLEQRKRIASAFVAERGSLQVAVHAGMQATATTAALAEHAATIGADAVAVIPPPYFPLDDDALFAHLRAAADACAPVPFYVYEFERTAGYAVSRAVLDRLRDACPNLAGMKVSDTPWEAFERYLDVGLDVFVGPEGFIGRGVERGAVGAVSALGSAFPEHVARAVRERSDELSTLREAIERFPRHAALKRVVARRGVPVQPDVCAPLRALTADEERALDEAVEPWMT